MIMILIYASIYIIFDNILKHNIYKLYILSNCKVGIKA
jgi:hypothetical protein